MKLRSMQRKRPSIFRESEDFVCTWIAPALLLLLSGYAHFVNIASFVFIGARLFESQLRFAVFYYVSSDKASSTVNLLAWPSKVLESVPPSIK